MKMAAAAGLALGWPKVATGVGLAVLSGGLWASFLLMTGKVDRKTLLPFAPIWRSVFMYPGCGGRYWFGNISPCTAEIGNSPSVAGYRGFYLNLSFHSHDSTSWQKETITDDETPDQCTYQKCHHPVG